MGGPPWDSKDLMADQNRRYRSFTEGGVLIPPRPHGGTRSKLYPDFPES